jgi:hypothetical protein
VTDLRKSLVGESRENGALLQINSANIRELDLGGNWDAHELGPSNCAFMAAVRTRIRPSPRSLNAVVRTSPRAVGEE